MTSEPALGNFCPQVLGYAEQGETGGMMLSLADLGCEGPVGFADIYAEALTTGKSAKRDGAIVSACTPCALIDVLLGASS